VKKALTLFGILAALVAAAAFAGELGGSRLHMAPDDTVGFFAETVANLGAKANMDLSGASVAKIRTVIEVGKIIKAKATAADCTGAGTIDVYILLQRLTAGATIAPL